MKNPELESKRMRWLEIGCQEKTAEVARVRFNYLSGPQSINPKLPDYAWVSSDGTEAVILISDSLPEEYQKLWAYHELVEFTQETPGEGRCARALERELSVIPECIRGEYINRRLAFFQNLINFGRQEQFPENVIKEFEKSLSKLEEITRSET